MSEFQVMFKYCMNFTNTRLLLMDDVIFIKCLSDEYCTLFTLWHNNINVYYICMLIPVT